MYIGRIVDIDNLKRFGKLKRSANITIALYVRMLAWISNKPK